MGFFIFMAIYFILAYYKTHAFLMLISDFLLTIIALINKAILLLIIYYIFLI